MRKAPDDVLSGQAATSEVCVFANLKTGADIIFNSYCKRNILSETCFSSLYTISRSFGTSSRRTCRLCSKVSRMRLCLLSVMFLRSKFRRLVCRSFGFRYRLMIGLGDWVPFPAAHSVMQVVARVSNRIFVGLPLCRLFLSCRWRRKIHGHISRSAL